MKQLTDSVFVCRQGLIVRAHLLNLSGNEVHLSDFPLWCHMHTACCHVHTGPFSDAKHAVNASGCVQLCWKRVLDLRAVFEGLARGHAANVCLRHLLLARCGLNAEV